MAVVIIAIGSVFGLIASILTFVVLQLSLLQAIKVYYLSSMICLLFMVAIAPYMSREIRSIGIAD